jgi:endonuclease/exonuclease/phosphatase family metal-dependent hydrolase
VTTGSEPSGSRLRVASLNLWSGRRLLDGGRPAPDPDGSALVRSTQVLRDLDVDVLAVQEVDRAQERSGGVDQLAAVAEAFAAVAWRFAPTLTGVPGPARGWQPVGAGAVEGPLPDGPSYGVGIVSRLPVLAWRVRALRGSRARLPFAVPDGGRPRVVLVPDEPRVALAAVVATAAGPVTVLSTHLSFSPPAAARQLRTTARWAASLPGPCVLAGDLNLPGRWPARLTGWEPLVVGATFPANAPRLQLDHLLRRAASTDSSPASTLPASTLPAPTPPTAAGFVVRLPVSDHRAVVGTVPLSHV